MTSSENDTANPSKKSETVESELLLPVVKSAETEANSNAIALPEGLDLPRLITDAGEKATWRFINFFTAEIENDNTRAAYFRAVKQFDVWCKTKGFGLQQLQPFIVAAYTKEMKETRHPQTVKQHLAALRMLFDSMVL